MQNFEINLLKSILIKILKSFSIYSISYKHNVLKILHFLSQDVLSYYYFSIIYYLFSKEKIIINKCNEIKLNKDNKTLRNNLAYYLL